MSQSTSYVVSYAYYYIQSKRFLYLFRMFMKLNKNMIPFWTRVLLDFYNHTSSSYLLLFDYFCGRAA